jgi:Fe(3+) dicitrate transport protein
MLFIKKYAQGTYITKLWASVGRPCDFKIRGNMKRLLFISIATLFTPITYGQTLPDTTKTHELSPVKIEGIRIPQDIQRLDPVQGAYIYVGKKTEVIDMTQKNVAITEKYGRQIFAKIPGVFVYDMDGTGNQMNISTRGLDPHRSWEFNIRKDGIVTNSDMYGYPASHYNIPMEAVERIELVRGTGLTSVWRTVWRYAQLYQ